LYHLFRMYSLHCHGSEGNGKIVDDRFVQSIDHF
jgi:hypothetical protein